MSNLDEDFLEVDNPIPGQNYVCLSFVSPEKELQKKDTYYIHSFLKEKADKYNLNIEFKNKPNIFLFSFDGLAPNKMLKDNYGIDLKLNASQENLLILSNTFNENVYTKPALNTLFLLYL